MNEFDHLLSGKNEPIVGNEYDEQLRQQQDMETLSLRNAATQAATTTPERAASVIKLSDRTGIPKQTVERNFDRVRGQVEVDYNEYDKMLAQTPKLAQWLKDGENFSVAKDDLERMGALEWLVTAPQRAFARGQAQVEFGKLRHQSMFRELTAGEQERLKGLRETMGRGGDLGAQTWFGKALTGGAEQLPNLFGGLMAGAKTGLPTAFTFGTAAGIAGQVGPQVALPEEIITVPAAAALGYYIGSTTGAAQFTFEQEAGHAFEEFTNVKGPDGKPLDRDVARMAALAAGGINSGLEVFQLHTLMRTIPGADKLFGAATRSAISQALTSPTVSAALKQLAVGYAKTLSAETTTEVVQRAVTILSGEIAKSTQGIENRKPDDIMNDLASEGIQAAQAFTYIVAPGHVARLGQDTLRIREAKKNEAFFTALGENVAESKVFERLPEKMQQFVEQATKDGPIDSVYVPTKAWQEYFQSKGLDPVEAAREALGDTTLYESAVQTGTDMRIPMALYATKLAPTEANKFFARELRLAPEEMNSREAEEFEEKLKVEEQEAAKNEEKNQATGEADQQVEAIRADMTAKLVAAGVEQSTAEAYATVHASAYRALSENAGVGGAALFEKRLKDLTISRETQPQPGTTEMAQSDPAGLIIQHNLTADNLMHAIKMGGIPVPSLAITKSEDGLTNYGEITLIGPRTMADPNGYANTRVFASDVYAPRYPTIHYKFTEAGLKVLGKIIAKQAKLTGQSYFDLDSLSKEGAQYLRGNYSVMAEVLEQNGIKVERVEAPADGHYSASYLSEQATHYAIREAVSTHGMQDKVEQFSEKLLRDMNPQEKIFRGFTNAGNRSYQPHTMENVVRILKRDIQGGEDKAGIYGIPSARAHFSPRFRTLNAIKAAKDRLVTDEEFEAVKKEAEAEFFNLAESLAPLYAHQREPFRYYDTVLSLIVDSAKNGLDRELKEYGFNAMPISDEQRQQIYEFTTHLRNMPTEYFEAKILRGVAVSEFAAAAVPEDLPQEALEALRENGVQVEFYTRHDEAGRKLAIQKLADRYASTVLFQNATIDGTTGEVMPADPFYSVLQQQVERLKLDKAPADQWKKAIAGLSSKGVKKEEVIVSGVMDWLDMKAANEGRESYHLLENDGTTLAQGDEQSKAQWERNGMRNGVAAGEQIVRVDGRPILGYFGGTTDSDKLAAIKVKNALLGNDLNVDRAREALNKQLRIIENSNHAFIENVNAMFDAIAGGAITTDQLPVVAERKIVKVDTRITKQDVLDYLNEHAVDVNTLIRGEPKEVKTTAVVAAGELPRGFSVGVVQVDGRTSYEVRDREGDVINDRRGVTLFSSHANAVRAAIDYATVEDDTVEDEDEISDDDVEERAQQLLDEDIPQMAEESARESEYANRSYPVALRAPNYKLQKVEGSGRIVDMFLGREVEPHWRVVEVTYNDMPEDDAVNDESSGNERRDFPDDADEFHQMFEPDTTDVIGPEFPSEGAAHAWARAHVFGDGRKGYDAPVWILWDQEQGRNSVDQGEEFEDFSDAHSAANDRRQADYDNEVEYYRGDGAPTLEDFGDRYRERARRELEEERDRGTDHMGRALPPARSGGALPVRHSGRWQSDGGRNYREMVLSIPNIEPYNKDDSTHFQPETGGKTIAWARFKIHDAADGTPTLFIEEIQSQRAQAGREHGFKRTPSREDMAKLDALDAEQKRSAQERRDALATFNRELGTDFHNALSVIEDDNLLEDVLLRTTAEQVGIQRANLRAAVNRNNEAIDAYNAAVRALQGGDVPSAPFVTDTKAWVALDLKRVLRYAVDKGIKQIAWTTGDQQVGRYGNWLREQVDTIDWIKTSEGISINARQRGTSKVERKFNPQELRVAIGRQMAEKIINSADQEGSLHGSDLTIDDLGMANFYGDADGKNPKGEPSIVSIVADKLVKSLGGAGVKSITMPVMENGVEHNAHPGFVIDDALAAKVKGGLPLFQDTSGQRRGRIRFGEDRKFNIDFLPGADLSTFLHESGHFWLEVLGDITSELRIADSAKLNDRQLRMLADYETLLKWMGVKDRSEIRVDQHEKFARAIEAYLMDGKAPSAELRSVFARFRAWLMSIYRTIRKLDVEISPEVREVMDRLFATDQEIDAAANEAQIEPMFTTAESAGMTPEEFKAYGDRVRKVGERARDELGEKLLRVVKREHEAWWKGEREKVRKDVAEAFSARPEYIAQSVLQHDQMPDGSKLAYDLPRVKLNRKALDEMLGAEGSWKSLPRGTTATDGVHPQVAADLFGFKSGADLVQSLKTTPPLQRAIDAEADRVMREKHGDPLVDGTLIDQAKQALHNEERSHVIAAEMKALAKLVAASKPAVEARRTSRTRSARRGSRAWRSSCPRSTTSGRWPRGRSPGCASATSSLGSTSLPRAGRAWKPRRRLERATSRSRSRSRAASF
jgi:hypothetical protein